MDALEVCRWRTVARHISCAVVFLLGTATLCAQTPQGEIRLQVKDPSGVPMQASGRLENLAGGVARDFQTDSQGMVVLAVARCPVRRPFTCEPSSTISPENS